MTFLSTLQEKEEALNKDLKQIKEATQTEAQRCKKYRERKFRNPKYIGKNNEWLSKDVL